MKRPARVGMKVAGIAFAIVATTLGFGSRPAAAYCTEQFSKWDVRTQTLQVWSNIDSAFNSTIWYSLAEWDYFSPLHYYYPDFGVTVAGTFNLRKKDFSAAGWMDEPAKTVNSTNSGTHHTSTVWMNTDYTWNLTGTMNKSQHKADVRTVLVHEFGHAAGLAHPAACGQMSQLAIDSAMNATWTKKWDTNQDDWWGIESLYE